MNLQRIRPWMAAAALASTMLVFGCDDSDSQSSPADPDAAAQIGGDPEGGIATDAGSPQATTQPPADETVPGGAPADVAPVAERTFTAEQLEQLVAPVALYPDPLLMDVLMAATYPAEVAEAAAWKKNSPNLNGKALDDAIADKGWDISVNALTHATQALELMAADPEWTRDLGDAFLAQQDDVLNAVQVMRNRACDIGNLKTTEQQQVVFEDAPAQPAQPAAQYVVPPPQRVVRIVPARPDVLYVPIYNPRVIYGPPPPVIFYPRVMLYPAIHVGVAPIISFGIGLTFGGLFWGDLDWHHHRIYARRYGGGYYGDHSQSWRDSYHTRAEVWRHDSRHRRGVAYPHPELHRRYGAAGTWSPDVRREMRYGASRDKDRDGGRGMLSPRDHGRPQPGSARAQREVSPRGRAGKDSPADRRHDGKTMKPGAGGGRPSPGIRAGKPDGGAGRPSKGRVEKPSQKGGGGRPPQGRVEKPSQKGGGGRPPQGRVERPSPKGGGGKGSSRPGGNRIERPSSGRDSSPGRGGSGGGRGSSGRQGGEKDERGGGKGKPGGR